MGRRRKASFTGACFVLIVLLTLGAGAAAQSVELFPIGELRPGLQGIGLTVIQGTTIEPFDIEVLGIVQGGGPVGSLILVQVGGDVIDRTGGLAAGMSGSPVYIDGKLVGAVGYGYELTDHRLALITPAREMFDLMDELVPPAESTFPELPDWPIEGVRPIRTPVMVSGSSGRSLEHLRDSLSRYHVETIPLGGGTRATANDESPVQPGSAIGVQLVRGDMNVTALGTVTAVLEDGRFAAFGHPFLHKGVVDFFATTADVLTTVPSLAFPFKMANPGSVIGAVRRDRGAGIAGTLDTKVKTVSLHVKSTDGDRNREEEFSVEVVYDKDLVGALLVAAALEALDRSVDRVGPGTSWVDLRFKTEGEKWRLARNNMYYSSSDIAAVTLFDLATALRILESNPFVEPDLTTVEIETRIESSRRTAQIEKAVPVVDEVDVGDGVQVRVTLRPYRSEPFEELVWLPIPPKSGAGPITVLVQGGQFFFSPFAGDEQGDDFEHESDIASFTHLIDEFQRQPKNNEIVFEFYPPDDSRRNEETGEDDPLDNTVDEQDEDGAENKPEPLISDSGDEEPMSPRNSLNGFDHVKPIRTVHPTNYVLRGETTFTLELMKPEVKEPAF